LQLFISYGHQMQGVPQVRNNNNWYKAVNFPNQ
jgi:hypothetical protein